MTTIKARLFIACTNPNGSPDMFHCVHTVTPDQFNNGSHIEFAKNTAIANGFQAPFVVFCNEQIEKVAFHVENMNCPIPFNLVDPIASGDDEPRIQKGSFLFSPAGINLKMDGYSDTRSEDNEGSPATLEYYGGNVTLRAFTDINREDATKSISFDGARNIHRA